MVLKWSRAEYIEMPGVIIHWVKQQPNGGQEVVSEMWDVLHRDGRPSLWWRWWMTMTMTVIVMMVISWYGKLTIVSYQRYHRNTSSIGKHLSTFWCSENVVIYSTQWKCFKHCKSVKYSAWRPAIATSPDAKGNKKNSTSWVRFHYATEYICSKW